jgi:hypothetical protein
MAEENRIKLQDSKCSVRYSNQDPPEYKSEALSIDINVLLKEDSIVLGVG